MEGFVTMPSYRHFAAKTSVALACLTLGPVFAAKTNIPKANQQLGRWRL
jgi:hypothetical protein